ncbi:MAG: CNNM domain-containing protein [Planctomycetota bacterium]
MLLVCSAAISASETALFSLTAADREALQKRSPGPARAAERLLARPRALLVTILFINMVVNISYLAVTNVLSTRTDNAYQATAVSLAALFALVLLGEVFAKTLASAHRVAYTALIAGPLSAVSRLLTPVRAVLDEGLVSPLARLVLPETKRAAMDADELAAVVDLAASRGDIDAAERRLLTDVLQLGQLRVRDIMTPRDRVPYLTPKRTHAETDRVLRAARLSHIPLTPSAALDRHVIGLVPRVAYLAARAHAVRERLPYPDAESLVVQARFVPEYARLDALLQTFQTTASDIALVADEHGDLVGLVTLDDLTHELLALASRADAGPQPRLIALGVWTIPGEFPLRDWARAFNLPRPEDASARVSTIAGLVQSRLARLPKPGDTIEVEGATLTVQRVTKRRVDTLRLELTPVEAIVQDGASDA